MTGAAASDTIVLPYNDVDAVVAAFAARGPEIACVITEACPANMGVVPPALGFNARLASLCQSAGALLIMDEVLQNGIARLQQVDGAGGHHAAPAEVVLRPPIEILKRKIDAVFGAGLFEDAFRGWNHFGSHAIAGDDCDGEGFHQYEPILARVPRRGDVAGRLVASNPAGAHQARRATPRKHHAVAVAWNRSARS